MKFILVLLTLLSAPSFGASVFDDVTVENTFSLIGVTAGRSLFVNGSGVVTASPTSSTELGYLTGVTSAIQTQLNTKEPAITLGTSLQYWRGDKTFQTLDKAAVGLGSVDNTSDTAKPISTATQTALNLKYDASNPSSYVNAAGASAAAPVQSVAGQTGTVVLTKSDVGLGNVDNTSDANKPVSTSTQTALNLKAALASPALTGTPTAPTQTQGDNSTKISTTAYVDTAVGAATIPDATTLVKGKVQLAGDLAGTASAPTVPGLAGKEPSITSGTTLQYWRGDKTFQTLDKAAVGLGNVDNTSDANKPVSTATQTALNLKAPVSSPALTGSPTAPTQSPADNSTKIATTAYADAAAAAATIPDATTSIKGKVKLAGDLAGTADLPTVPGLAGKEPTITAGIASQYYRGDKTFQTLDKTAVGLANVDNTSDANKPISTATATALSGKEPSVSAGTSAQYWRGDKTFQTLNTLAVPELTNLYYTDARVSSFVSPIYAPLASPALTGIPTAPTATTGTNTTQIATTAFVTDATSQPMPSASTTSLVTTTSASTTFVTALTTSITIGAASAPILAKCVLDMSSATAVSVGSTRVTINAVSGGAVQESFTVLGTQRLTVPNQYLSASLAAGTYTVTCEFNRISGTGTVTVNQGSLTAVALQGSRAVTGVVTLAGGGTNASNTAVNGGVAYGTASAINLSAAGTTGQVLRSAGAAAPTWTAQTYPASTTINELMYSSASNVVSGLATANTGALVTSSTGVPSLTSGATANRVLRTNGTAVTFAQVAAATDISGVLPVANGGTALSSAFTASRAIFSNGTTLASDALYQYTTANTRFLVGQGGGTGRINGTVSTTDPTPNDLAGNFFSRATANAAVNVQNENTLPTMNITNSGGATGANILFSSSRGTLPARTQSLSGDAMFSLLAQGRTATAWSTGYAAGINVFSTENTTDTTNGGALTLTVTPNGGATPIERVRLKSDGRFALVNSHLQSSQTTAPTAVVNANAGTGATCTVSNATDMAGKITIVTGTLGVSAGSYCDVTFNAAYVTAPICTLTPASATLSTSVYVTSTTTTLSPSFAVAGGISSTYVLNYNCVETQ